MSDTPILARSAKSVVGADAFLDVIDEGAGSPAPAASVSAQLTRQLAHVEELRDALAAMLSGGGGGGGEDLRARIAALEAQLAKERAWCVELAAMARGPSQTEQGASHCVCVRVCVYVGRYVIVAVVQRPSLRGWRRTCYFY